MVDSDMTVTINMEADFDAADICEDLANELYIAANQLKATADDIRRSDE